MKKQLLVVAGAFMAAVAVATTVLTREGGFSIVDPDCPEDVRHGVAFTIATEPVGDLALFGEDAQITKITSDGRSFNPSFSPDGTQVAFTVGTSEYDDTGGFWSQSIVISNVDGTDVREMTNGRHLDLEPAWSPDGAAIAFTRADIYPDDPDRSKSALMLVPAEGGEPELLFTKDGFEPRSAEWSPEGDRIAFVAREGIHVINKDGSELRTIASGLGAGSISWSPDGETFAFVAGDGIYTLTFEEPNPHLRKGGSEFRSVEFSPDGTHFLYVVEPIGRLRGEFEGTRGMVAPVEDGDPEILVDESEVFLDSETGQDIGGLGGKDWLDCS